MKKYLVLLLIVVSIILSLSITVNAEYIEPLPANSHNLPYMLIVHYDDGPHSNASYAIIYSSEPLYVISTDAYGDETGYLKMDTLDGGKIITLHTYIQIEGEYTWGNESYSENFGGNLTCSDIVYANYSLGLASTTFELEESQSSFFGIDFDYSGFFSDLHVKLGKQEDNGTYKIIKEWQYPKGDGHVSIPASEIPQGNKGEYIITILEGDTIINQYPYTLNVEEKGPYCEINYPVNGQDYDYFPNVNIRYYDMGRLYIYINGEMYKQIQTKNKEGIEVVEGSNDLFDIGLNTVTVRDSNGQAVATVQYMVMREGSDTSIEHPEFEAESWVQELFNRIMNEYSLFFTYVKGIYSFLPVEIVGLVVIIMMLAVILWFTGRR